MQLGVDPESPPARVAWIETFLKTYQKLLWLVATREGGVDRNDKWEASYTGSDTSPPARVAWIETTTTETRSSARSVATREGGVDRNI